MASKTFETYYHYTTVTGCFGIIDSRKIWLTDYRYLNDKMELRQGLGSFLSKIRTDQRKSFERAFRWHDMFNHHCVFSLSHSPKILSQWRAYASDGVGMAIGFSSTFLKFAGLSLVECRYEDHDTYSEKVARKHELFVETVHNASENIRAENEFMNWVRANATGFYNIVEDLIALKNPAFSEEKELRAIRSCPMGDDSLKVRVARDLIIPYVEVDIWREGEEKSAFSVVTPEIWLGPKCSELNRNSILVMDIGMCDVQRHDCGYV
ncbi:DUF2971 domain-containing protein [Pseudomonas fluorescens]|uniref:DUF2971 domain-containing protein n=1 Tax=Pseudomonas fluorescens TaxID=294 RepID=UPI000999541E|nr:DUF2971 domain-containing protein [Pseudomonas fluorescens]